MDENDEIVKKVIKNLNSDFGVQLFTKEKCEKVKTQFSDNIAEINKKLDLDNPDTPVAVSIKNGEVTIKKVNDISQSVDSCMGKVERYLQDGKEFLTEIENSMLQLSLIECTEQYLKVVQNIETLCKELEIHLKNNDDEQCATAFANITEIARHLEDVPTINLRHYLKETVDHWFNILKSKFTQDFNQILNAIHWPFINVNFGIEIPNATNIKKLQTVVEYLLQIDLPVELVTPVHQFGLLADFPLLSLPVELLIEPLKKRFLFHFYGSRKTNRTDKPEWYFTKILSWIRDHSDFVDKWIQPIVDKIGLHHIEVKTELMRGLVQLAVEKLYGDLPTLQFDDFAFSHCVDEALGFDKELKMNYNYPENQPSILVVLTQAQVFMKWLAMEKKYALEKMDAMLSDSMQENVLVETGDTEKYKITQFSETFVTLLQIITERYEVLPQPGHRLQFLDLQLELLDDFRVRLLQLGNVEDDEGVNFKIALIANAAHYIESVLTDWGQMLHFLHLYYHKTQIEGKKLESVHNSELGTNSPSDIDTDTVFTDTLLLYRHMKNDLLHTLVDSIVTKARYSSKNYRHELWSRMPVMKDIRSYSLTPSACPIFEVLGTKLHQLQKFLTQGLFTIVWKSVAQQIDTFLYEKLVQVNTFDEGGAKQFEYDITRNLLPLFAQYTDNPNSYCPCLSESCILLNISKGSGLLLRDLLIGLDGATGLEDKREQALKEIGVEVISPLDSLNILNLRMDLALPQSLSFD